VKERLTGAAILVALIVLLVPELLRGPVRPVAHAATATAGEVPLRTVTIKVGDDSHAHDAMSAAANGPQQPVPIPADTESSPPPASGTAAPEPTAEAPPPKAETPVPKPAPVPAAEHAPSSQPAPAAPAVAESAAPGGAFMVQLGSFASHDNAERLAGKVKAQGFPVSVSRSTTGKHLYKVLVGPARDHAAAVQLEAKLRGSGHNGTIVAK
jgi:DedD protein